MLFRIAAAAAAVSAARLYANTPELDGISAEGPFIVFAFDQDASLDQHIATIEGWDAFVGGLIADANNDEIIAALSQLKRAITNIERDVTRESYMRDQRKTSVAEATSADEISHPTGTGDASISQSSQSNGALSDQKEEIEYEQAQQAGSGRRSRRR